MVAKKWRPLKYFTAEEGEWGWNNFDFAVVFLSSIAEAPTNAAVVFDCFCSRHLGLLRSPDCPHCFRQSAPPRRRRARLKLA